MKTTAADLLFIPEIIGLDARSSIVRIPPELDVPLTPRVRRIVDSRAFRRLADVSQLGFVRFVYPGATHTRFEHSLGVYRLSLVLLKRLAHDERFASLVRVEEAETFILAALLHDVGHFPYCHLIEDLKLPEVASHEELATDYITGELGPLLRDDWGIKPENVLDILLKRAPRRQENETDEGFARREKVFRLLASALSGPIDVDKMDYLMRDSCGSGVPYGKNYDIDRLVGSLRLNERGDGIAISSKGKTAAELMVFARYVMFSEVYWHHAARSATVMFQRLVALLSEKLGAREFIDEFRRKSDREVGAFLFSCCGSSKGTTPALDREATRLCDGLFGERRLLFKRVRQFSAMEEPELYRRIAGRPYREIMELSRRLAIQFGIREDDVLVDAPPVDKEVEFKIDVFYPDEGSYRPLAEASPVVRALAREQFDDYVKRARIFASSESVSALRSAPNFNRLLEEALNEVDVLNKRQI